QNGPAPAAQGSQQVRQNLLLETTQASSRFIEDNQNRVGGERARDFQQTLLTERQIARRFARLFSKADPLQLLQSLASCGFFLFAIEPDCAGKESRPCTRVCSEQDIIEQCHVWTQFHVLEGAADALRGDLARRQIRHVGAHKDDL